MNQDPPLEALFLQELTTVDYLLGTGLLFSVLSVLYYVLKPGTLFRRRVRPIVPKSHDEPALQIMEERAIVLRTNAVSALWLVCAFVCFGFALLLVAEDPYEKTRGLDERANGAVLAFISLLAIRVAMIVLVLYACQVVLRYYRYTSMRADHYQALVDATVLERLAELHYKEGVALAHPKLDIGNSPIVSATQWRMLVTAVKEWLSRSSHHT